MAALRTLSLGLALALAQGSAGAQPAPSDSGSRALSGWTFGVSPWTVHYSQARKEHDFEPDTQRHSYVWLVQAEKALDERHIAGLALFKNSFGQPTQYLYYGWQWRPLDSAPGLFVKLTGGVIHGYKEPYPQDPVQRQERLGPDGDSGRGLRLFTPLGCANQRAGQRGADVSAELHDALIGLTCRCKSARR